MTRSARLVFHLCLMLVWPLPLLSAAHAETVTISSASPYQLADLLGAASPVFDQKITAELELPKPSAKTMPAFVFMHGSGGPLLRHHRYLEMARSLGFVTLQLDSFGPRGVGSTVGNQTNVTAAMMATDLLKALEYLSRHPDIDPDRIVVMGSSKGAIAALYASWAPTRKKVAGDKDFAGYALLYPLCAAIEDANVTKSPVRVFIGEKDNWTPAAPCIRQVDRMKALGFDWSIHLYAGAYHGFDAPIEGIRDMPHAYSMSDCDIALRTDGYEYETNSGYLLTKAERRMAFRACVKRGEVKMGGHHAVEPFLRDLETFLKAFL